MALIGVETRRRLADRRTFVPRSRPSRMVLGGESRLGTYLGVGAFVVGLAGYLLFGWSFGGETENVGLVFGIVAAWAAIVLTLRR